MYYTYLILLGTYLSTINTQILPSSCLGDFSYLFLPTSLSFADSQIECQNLQGNLATLNNAEINDFIEVYLTSLDISSDVWFGLIRLQGLDTTDPLNFNFIDGNEIFESGFGSENGINPWSVNEPNGNNNEIDTCVIVSTSESFLWFDRPCTQTNNAICQIQNCTLNPTNSPTKTPTKSPIQQPTVAQTQSPSVNPSKSPSDSPTKSPSVNENETSIAGFGNVGVIEIIFLGVILFIFCFVIIWSGIEYKSIKD